MDSAIDWEIFETPSSYLCGKNFKSAPSSCSWCISQSAFSISYIPYTISDQIWSLKMCEFLMPFLENLKHRQWIDSGNYLLMAIEQDYWTTKIWPFYLLSGNYRFPWEDSDIFITPICKSTGSLETKYAPDIRKNPGIPELQQLSKQSNQPLNLYPRASIWHILSGNVK